MLFAFAALFVTPAVALDVKEVRSPQGITAYLAEDHANPIVAIAFAFTGGAALDSPARVGLSQMAAALLDEGAGDLDSFAFQSELEDRAIQMGFSADKDAVRGSLSVTTPNAARGYELLRLALTQPRFDAEPVERIRRQILVKIARDSENPGRLAARRLAEMLYGDHPYARNDDGTADTVGAITVEDLRAWRASRFARDRLIVAAAGDITPAGLARVLDEIFGALPADNGRAPALPEAAVSTAPRTERIVKNLPQSVLYIGQRGISRKDPDWYVAQVADYIFGSGSFSSRLMNEVREKRGLAYGVSSSLNPLERGATMTVGAGTRSDQLDASLAVIRDEWRKMQNPGPTAEELEGAKQYLTGAWPLRFTSTGRIADILVQVQKDDLGLDYLDKRNGYIEAVTLDDLRRVARTLYAPDELSVVIVGPAP